VFKQTVPDASSGESATEKARSPTVDSPMQLTISDNDQTERSCTMNPWQVYSKSLNILVCLLYNMCTKPTTSRSNGVWDSHGETSGCHRVCRFIFYAFLLNWVDSSRTDILFRRLVRYIERFGFLIFTIASMEPLQEPSSSVYKHSLLLLATAWITCMMLRS